MLYLFTGNSDFLIVDEIQRWKQRFLEKFGEHNIFHVRDVSEVSFDFLHEILLSAGLFVEKKLIIIEGFPFSAENKKNFEIYEKFFLNIIGKVPEENIVVFVSPEADKRSKAYKEFKTMVQEKDFSFSDEMELMDYLMKKYHQKVSRPALSLLYRFKAGNLSKMIQEIEKLLILTPEIGQKEIQSYVSPELEESMFLLVDSLLQKKYRDFLQMTKNLLLDMNEYAFLMAFLGNLRNYGYIHYFKHHGFSVAQLGLGNKAFLANKTFKMQAMEVISVYQKFISLESRLKKGNFLGNEQEDFLYEIEKILLETV